MSEYDIVEALGVRVYEVSGLVERSIFCPETGSLFVRAGLDADQRRANAEWAVSEALDELAEATR